MTRLQTPFLAAILLASSLTLTPAQAANPMLILTTTVGDIHVELDQQAAPLTVQNMIDYVEAGYLDGLIFHRVIPNFMIQGGGFTPDMKQRPPGPPIQNEADNGLKNKVGTIAMARTSAPHSATAQFFINVIDNDFLNHASKTPKGWGYAVFGHVTEGMDIVKTIAVTPTTTIAGQGNVPTTPIIITKAKITSP